MVRIIGITGGIASGKSTVTEFLRQQGYQVIDADQVVHELQEPGGAALSSSFICFWPSYLTGRWALGPAQAGSYDFWEYRTSGAVQSNTKPYYSRGTGWQARYAGRDGRHLFLWIFPCCLSYNMRTGLTRSGWWT